MLARLKQVYARIERRHPRKSVLWSADLVRGYGEIVNAIVLDISAGGAKLAVNHAFRKGEIVYFCSPRIDRRQAQVIWTTSDRIGIKFSDWDDSLPHASAEPDIISNA